MSSTSICLTFSCSCMFYGCRRLCSVYGRYVHRSTMKRQAHRRSLVLFDQLRQRQFYKSVCSSRGNSQGLSDIQTGQAAEIGIGGPSCIQQLGRIDLLVEHNLGLTCDPIDGLVQVPCIVCSFLSWNNASDCLINFYLIGKEQSGRYCRHSRDEHF